LLLFVFCFLFPSFLPSFLRRVVALRHRRSFRVRSRAGTWKLVYQYSSSLLESCRF